MGRLTAFLPVQTGMRHPGALDVQTGNPLAKLYSLPVSAAALIEEKA
ncbi:MAG: hypothetical protein ACRCWL_00730 [Aeromonas sp.]